MTDQLTDDRPRIDPEPPHSELDSGPGVSPRILMLVALAVILVIVAVGAGVFRDRLARLIGPAETATESQERVQLQQRVDQLESELELSRRQAAGVAASTDPVEGDGEVVAAPVELSVFEERIIALEAAQARMSRAAAAAVAAASLADAAEGSEPFAGELASMERLVPTSRGIRALRDLAEQGAPTRAALAAEFPEAASRGARAAHGESDPTGFVASMSRALGQIFSLRRIGSVEGDHPDAILARAERFAREGDLEDALTELQALPEPSRNAMQTWIDRAQRRVEIERRIDALRAQALGDLSGISTAETGAPL